MTERHPPLAPGWIDRPHLVLECGDLPLESGEVIRDCKVSYVMHGDPAVARNPVVVVLTAIASTHHRLDFLIGPGKALDPAQHCILAIDALGNGLSSSPSNSLAQPGWAFPRFTIRDMVASQKRLLDHLGMARVHAIVGASMGGMQALQWGVSHPEMALNLVAMTPMAKTHAWSLLVNETLRRAMSVRVGWDTSAGESRAWDAWVPLMQLLAGRTPQGLPAGLRSATDVARAIGERVAMQAAGGLAPIDWYYQSLAYDAHDIGTTPGFRGDRAKALAAVAARTLILAPSLDLYNPAEAARDACLGMPNAQFAEIPSRLGHQSASGVGPAETAFLNRTIGEFLRSGPGCGGLGLPQP